MTGPEDLKAFRAFHFSNIYLTTCLFVCICDGDSCGQRHYDFRLLVHLKVRAIFVNTILLHVCHKSFGLKDRLNIICKVTVTLTSVSFSWWPYLRNALRDFLLNWDKMIWWYWATGDCCCTVWGGSVSVLCTPLKKLSLREVSVFLTVSDFTEDYINLFINFFTVCAA